MKICFKCKQNKSLKNFSKDKTRKGGIQYKCKECQKKHDTKRNSLHEFKLKNNKYSKERRKVDLNFKIKHNILAHINKICKSQKTNKKSKVINLIGCNIIEYITYIESQFLPEMNWLNHGKIWEIDHIKPLDSFNLIEIEEQFIAFNYKNVQPLFKTTEIAESFGYKNYIGNKEKSKKLILGGLTNVCL
jgi:hypothetical protein